MCRIQMVSVSNSAFAHRNMTGSPLEQIVVFLTEGGST